MYRTLLMVVLALFVISGCSLKPKTDNSQELREVAWNSLTTEDQQEVPDWKIAKVEESNGSDMPAPKGGEKYPKVEHLFKVSFESKSDKIVGPILVFVDGDTKKTVSYSKTVK